MRSQIKKSIGFTLMEIMIVISLLGLMAAFAIPNYTKSINKSHETDMANQLLSLHAANTAYFAQNNNAYWDDGAGTETNVATINSALNIDLIPNDGTTFAYDGAGNTFTATASWGGFTVQITEAPIDGTNPSCGGGACPSLP